MIYKQVSAETKDVTKTNKREIEDVKQAHQAKTVGVKKEVFKKPAVKSTPVVKSGSRKTGYVDGSGSTDKTFTPKTVSKSDIENLDFWSKKSAEQDADASFQLKRDVIFKGHFLTITRVSAHKTVSCIGDTK